MEAVSQTAVGRFTAPASSLASLGPEGAGALIAAASDVALVLDVDGKILDASFADADFAKEADTGWVGRSFLDIVTVESRPKIADLVRDANAKAPTRWRQVNHPVEGGADIPVRYCTMRFGSEGRIVALGRDLRAMASLQQRLAEAQQSMEREYSRIRSAEKRYRLLFQLASEAVLIVDSASHRVIEANPAAAALIGGDAKKLIGHAFDDLFDEGSRRASQSFVAAARVAPRVDNVHVTLAKDATPLLLSGSLFRQENAANLLVILSRVGGGAKGVADEELQTLALVDAMPEAFVVTDSERKVLRANNAFLDLVQATTQAQVRGQPLERWIGRPGVDVDLLFTNIRTHGAVRHFSTLARGEFGAEEDVEIAAVSALNGAEPCIGFTIRAAGWRAGKERLGGRELPRTAEQFVDLVGRVPLKNLVRETTDLIERLCIEAALELTRDNRASAAEMLGLSRQGLYAKLRRYGLGDLDGEEG